MLPSLDPLAKVCCEKSLNDCCHFMKTMLKVGDYVRHLSTGNLGQVIAYSHDIRDSVYQPTLKVEVINPTEIDRRAFVEDVSTAWVLAEQTEASNN